VSSSLLPIFIQWTLSANRYCRSFHGHLQTRDHSRQEPPSPEDGDGWWRVAI
jgi:hypothetical protein